MKIQPAPPGSAASAQDKLRINEIFLSLQGETRTAGCPTVFVRLTGCPLRCGYCDTAYAFSEGHWMTIGEIVSRVEGYGTRHVTVTGGEPLAQRPCRDLLTRLCEAGRAVSLETSGALDIAGIDPRISVVMDLKTPGSGEQDKNRLDNIALLRAHDQVKFVITDRADYDWSCAQLRAHNLAARCDVFFSPAFGTIEPRTLADWILTDRLPVRLQVQLHKILWGEERGR